MTPETKPALERRSVSRTVAPGELTITVLSFPAEARLREISTGGFAVHTQEPLPEGVHGFRIELEGIVAVELAAERVHCARLSLAGGPDTYLAGFEFLPHSDDTTRALAALVDHLSAVGA